MYEDCFWCEWAAENPLLYEMIGLFSALGVFVGIGLLSIWILLRRKKIRINRGNKE